MHHSLVNPMPGAPFLARSVREKWGVKPPLDARIHLFLFDERLPLGLRDASPHGGAKTSALFTRAQGGILHQRTVAETVLPRNWKICHPERSNHFAQRSGCEVE